MSSPRYSMMINWSDEDQAYVVCVPEFGAGAKTYGGTLAGAVRMGEELIESLIGWKGDEGTPPPPPLLFDPVTNYAPDPFKTQPLAAELAGLAQYRDGDQVRAEPEKTAAEV